MFYDQMYVKCNPKMLDKIETCSFRKKEVDLLQYVTDFSIFDVSKLPDEEEVRRIYAKDKNIEEEKIDELIKIMSYKAEKIRIWPQAYPLPPKNGALV
jgi:hypothetical protein